MKIWKVILATLVIFAAGAFTGVVVTKARAPKVLPAEPPVPPVLGQQRFQHKLKKELELTGDVTNRIDKIFADSNARIKIIWDLLNPEMQKELKEVRDNIRAELTPEQREKFEQMLKAHREGFRRSGPRGTNQISSTNGPPLSDK